MMKSKHLQSMVLVAAALFYFVYISLIFYPWADCFVQPLVRYDHGFHFANAKNVTENLIHNQRSWGYSALIAGGYTEYASFSSKIIVLANMFLFFLSKPLVYNVAVCCIMMMLPFLFVYAFSLFTRRRAAWRQFYIYCIFYLIGSKLGREFIYVGHYGFLLGVTLAFMAGGFFWRFLLKRKNKDLIFQALCSALAIWTHVLMPVLLLLIYVPIVCSRWRLQLKSDFFKAIGAMLVVSIMLNLVWLVPLLKTIVKFCTAGPIPFLQNNAFHSIESYTVASGLLFVFLLLLRRRNKLVYGLSAVIIVLLIISFAGSHLGLEILQPVRFLIPLSFLLLALDSYLCIQKSSLMMLILLTCTIFELVRANGDYKFVQGCGMNKSEEGKLLKSIKENVSSAERLLVQDSIHLPYYNTRIIPVLSYYTGVSILARSFTFPTQFFSFVDETIFGKKLGEIETAQLRNYLDIYNIGHVLVFSETAKRVFERDELGKKIFVHDNIVLYKINNSCSSYCIQCSAKIAPKTDRIVVTNVTTGSMILKFYYNAKLKVFPPSVIISPMQIADDPKPFIHVNNRLLKDFTIYM